MIVFVFFCLSSLSRASVWIKHRSIWSGPPWAGTSPASTPPVTRLTSAVSPWCVQQVNLQLPFDFPSTSAHFGFRLPEEVMGVLPGASWCSSPSLPCRFSLSHRVQVHQPPEGAGEERWGQRIHPSHPQHSAGPGHHAEAVLSQPSQPPPAGKEPKSAEPPLGFIFTL